MNNARGIINMSILINKARLITLIIFVLFCVSCSNSAEDIEILTSDEILKYVENNYGDAELLDTIETKDSIECTFKDSQYGFEYYVKSSIDSLWELSYYEDIDSNFNSEYINYLLNDSDYASDIDNFIEEYNIDIEVSSYIAHQIFRINIDDNNIKHFDFKRLKNILLDYDSRGYFNNGRIDFYDNKNNNIGYCEYPKMKYNSYKDK